MGNRVVIIKAIKRTLFPKGGKEYIDQALAFRVNYYLKKIVFQRRNWKKGCCLVALIVIMFNWRRKLINVLFSDAKQIPISVGSCIIDYIVG